MKPNQKKHTEFLVGWAATYCNLPLPKDDIFGSHESQSEGAPKIHWFRPLGLNNPESI